MSFGLKKNSFVVQIHFATQIQIQIQIQIHFAILTYFSIPKNSVFKDKFNSKVIQKVIVNFKKVT